MAGTHPCSLHLHPCLLFALSRKWMLPSWVLRMRNEEHELKGPSSFICIRKKTIFISFKPQLCMCVFSVTYNQSENESHSVMSNSLWPHGLLPARLLCPWGFSRQEYWSGLPIAFFRGSSQPRDWIQVSHVAGRFFTRGATKEAKEYWSGWPIPASAQLSYPGIKPVSAALQADSLPTELSGKPTYNQT